MYRYASILCSPVKRDPVKREALLYPSPPPYPDSSSPGPSSPSSLSPPVLSYSLAATSSTRSNNGLSPSPPVSARKSAAEESGVFAEERFSPTES